MLRPFVSATQVRRLLADDGADLHLFDVRRSPDGAEGPDTYLRGHLPGAVFVDLDEVLSDPPGGNRGRHPLPDAARFAAWLRAHGVDRDSTVVAYDTVGGAFAARMVWMLRIQGVAAALLATGLDGFEDNLATGEASVAPAAGNVDFAAWPSDALASIQDVEDGVGLLLDARAGERFRGETEPLDPVAGHIPGAVNIPWQDNLDGGSLRPDDELRARYAEAGVDDGEDVVVYCGSGVTACHDALAIEHLGLPRPRVFVGSWSAWSADPSREVATGPA